MNPDGFEQGILEKISRNFLNDDFFRKLLDVRFNSDGEKKENEDVKEDSATLFEKILEFAKECYIHGITVGINAAVEIYEENDR